MARKEAGYPLKSPRRRPHDLVARAIDQVEDAIYVLVAALLVVAGAFLLWSAVTGLFTDLSKAKDPGDIVLSVLDKGLILFIIAELLHTVRVTIQERTLVAEPFLVVALIAGIRRLLLTTAQAAQPNKSFQWNPQGIEITILLGLVLGMTLALILWRRFYGMRPGAEE